MLTSPVFTMIYTSNQQQQYRFEYAVNSMVWNTYVERDPNFDIWFNLTAHPDWNSNKEYAKLPFEYIIRIHPLMNILDVYTLYNVAIVNNEILFKFDNMTLILSTEFCSVKIRELDNSEKRQCTNIKHYYKLVRTNDTYSIVFVIPKYNTRNILVDFVELTCSDINKFSFR